MKTSDHTTTSRNLQHQKSKTPFGKKDGEPLFFSESQLDIQPFFNPEPQVKQNYFFNSNTIQAKRSSAVNRPSNVEAFSTDLVQTQEEVSTEDRDLDKKEAEVQRKPIFESEEEANPPTEVQAKLKIGQAGDKYEQEADAVADQVINKLSNKGTQKKQASEVNPNTVQTQTEELPEQEDQEQKQEEGEVRRKPIFESENDPKDNEVQPKRISPKPIIQLQAEEGADTEKSEEQDMEEGEAMREEAPQGERTQSATEDIKMSDSSATEGKSGGESTEGGAESPEGAVSNGAQSGGTGTPGTGQTTKIAEAVAKDSSGAEGDGAKEKGELDIPISEEGYELPEPDENMPGQMPAPIPLGISKGQQQDMILSKGANVEEASSDLSDKLQQTKGKGQSLDGQTSQQMGQEIGADFKDVKIHTDSEAAAMNQDIGAKAFTHGKDIYFNKGQFDTNSTEGKRLLAHELTHTVQQGAVSNVSPKRENPDGPKAGVETPEIQLGVWDMAKGAAGGFLKSGASGAVSGLLGSGAAELAKQALRALGDRVMNKILEEVLGLQQGQEEKGGDWQSQLINMGQEFVLGQQKGEQLLGEANTKAEEGMAIKQGADGAEKGEADPLPTEIMALLEKVLNFATGSGEGGKGALMGTDQATEQEAVQAGVQQDMGNWEQIYAMANEVIPMVAGEEGEEIQKMLPAMRNLKDSGWASLPAWIELIQVTPGLSGMFGEGKQAMNDGLNQLKEKFGENTNELWGDASKLANSVMEGSKLYEERVKPVIDEISTQLTGDADSLGNEQMGKAQGLEGQGNQIINFLKGFMDERTVNVINTIQTAITEGQAIISAIPGKIGQAVRSVFNSIKGMFNQGKGKLNQIIAKVKQFITRIKNAIAQKIQQAIQFMKRMAQKAIDAAKRFLQKAWAKIKEVAQKAWAKAKEIIKKITAKIKALLQPLIDWFKKKIIAPIKKLINRAKEWIKKKMEALKEKLGGKKKDEKEKGNLAAALNEIERRAKAELDQGEVTRNEADTIKNRVNRGHKEAINITSVTDGGESWEFEYIQKKKKSVPKTAGKRPILTEKTKITPGNPTEANPLTKDAPTIGNSSRAVFDTWTNLAVPVNMAFDTPGTEIRGQKGPWVRGHIIHYKLGGDGSKKENIFIIDRKANEEMSSKFESPAIKKLNGLVRRPKPQEKDKVMYYKVSYTTWGTSPPLSDFGKNITIEYGTMNKDGSSKVPLKNAPLIQSKTKPPTDPNNITIDIRGLGRKNIAQLLGKKGIIPEFAHYLSFTMSSVNFRSKTSLTRTLLAPRNISAYKENTSRTIRKQTVIEQTGILNGIISDDFTFKLK